MKLSYDEKISGIKLNLFHIKRVENKVLQEFSFSVSER